MIGQSKGRLLLVMCSVQCNVAIGFGVRIRVCVRQCKETTSGTSVIVYLSLIPVYKKG